MSGEEGVFGMMMADVCGGLARCGYGEILSAGGEGVG